MILIIAKLTKHIKTGQGGWVDKDGLVDEATENILKQLVRDVETAYQKDYIIFGQIEYSMAQ